MSFLYAKLSGSQCAATVTSGIYNLVSLYNGKGKGVEKKKKKKSLFNIVSVI